MFKKIDGVLLDLNEAEREAFNTVLALAQRHVDETGRFKWSDGRYMSAKTSQDIVISLIEGLREELDLRATEADIQPPTADEVEAWRRRLAVRNDDDFTNRRWVKCAFDRCGTTLYRANGVRAQHPWVQALEEGWKPLDHKHYGVGGFSKTLGRPSVDLECSLPHDEHGCPIYDGDKEASCQGPLP